MVDAENTIYLTPAEVLQLEAALPKVEVSPGGIGFIRTKARKDIPGYPEAARNARRLSWLDRDPIPHEYDGDPLDERWQVDASA